MLAAGERLTRSNQKLPHSLPRLNGMNGIIRVDLLGDLVTAVRLVGIRSLRIGTMNTALDY